MFGVWSFRLQGAWSSILLKLFLIRSCLQGAYSPITAIPLGREERGSMSHRQRVSDLVPVYDLPVITLGGKTGWKQRKYFFSFFKYILINTMHL